MSSKPFPDAVPLGIFLLILSFLTIDGIEPTFSNLYENEDRFKMMISNLKWTISLILFMIIVSRKLSKIRDQRKKDTYSLVFGCSGIIFLSIVAQIDLWWYNYDAKIGLFHCFLYLFLSLTFFFKFIFGTAEGFHFHYGSDRTIWMRMIPLLTFLEYLLLGCWEHSLINIFYNFFLSTYYVEVYIIAKGKYEYLYPHLNLDQNVKLAEKFYKL